jgi:hypothetical protein
MSKGREGVVWGIRRDLKCFSAWRNGVWEDDGCGSGRWEVVMAYNPWAVYLTC